MGNNFGRDLLILNPIGMMAAGIAGKGDVIAKAAEDAAITIANTIEGHTHSIRYMYPPWKGANGFLRDDWMTKMSENISEKRLIDIRIPGTHDSASYSCNQYVAMCQNADIKQQLVRGIRFLDIRIGWDFLDRPGGVRVGHGIFSWGTSFENIISDIYDFVSTHPKEFIIILNGKAADLENEDKTFIKDQYIQRLGKWMVKEEDKFDLSVVKLKDLWEKDRRLWVFNDDWNDILNINEQIGKEIGLWPLSPYLFGKYADTTNNYTMYKEINNQLIEGQKNNCLLLHYLTLTPPGFQAALDGVQPLTLDLQVPNTYIYWFNEHQCSCRINIVIIDFIFGASEEACDHQLNFLDVLINSNNDKQDIKKLISESYSPQKLSFSRNKLIKNKNNEYLCTNIKINHPDLIHEPLVICNLNNKTHYWVFFESSKNKYLLQCSFPEYMNLSNYFAYLSIFDSNIVDYEKYGLEKNIYYTKLVYSVSKPAIWILDYCGDGWITIKEEQTGLYLNSSVTDNSNFLYDSIKYTRLSETKELWQII